MPRITPINPSVSAQTQIGGRRATPQDFGAGTGLVAAGKTLSNISAALQESQQRQEVSDVQVRLAKLRADSTVEFDQLQREAVPGDTTVAEKFVEKIQNQVDALGENVSTGAGTRALSTGSATLMADITRAAFLMQADLAGKKAKQDFLTTLGANRNTLLTDPTQYPSVLDSTLAALKDPQGVYALMPAAARLKLATQARQDITQSAVQGWIRLNPEFALKQLQDGKFDGGLDANDKQTLLREAVIGIRGQSVEAARVLKAQVDALKAKQEAVKSDFAGRIYGTTDNPLTVRDILDSPISAADKEHYVSLLRKEASPKKTDTDYSVMAALYDRISTGALTDQRELDKHFGVDLAKEDLNFLRLALDRAKDPAKKREGVLQAGFLKAIKGQLTATNALFGTRDPKGDANYVRFLAVFLPEYDQLRQEGKTPAQLLDPDSKDYLGKLAVPLIRSTTEQLRDTLGTNAAPGRSIADRSTLQAEMPDGRKIFKVDGVWVFADGKKVSTK